MIGTTQEDKTYCKGPFTMSSGEHECDASNSQEPIENHIASMVAFSQYKCTTNCRAKYRHDAKGMYSLVVTPSK